eukprot:CAMPEP_0118924640 /NCGR_PEP_ID=MMETSP1169-20130426/2684_1 /TAXON_ID=36882 /ORGANISM="Pyramimonas obovata, Strain CCMP722" /LENGTH=65 /DNA_ID=CAMNT_0006865771 /DNA_START=586 /DNA_END=783 /DNA_ORIENTATION=+
MLRGTTLRAPVLADPAPSLNKVATPSIKKEVTQSPYRSRAALHRALRNRGHRVVANQKPGSQIAR